jgi:uncharacterized protein DUF4242
MPMFLVERSFAEQVRFGPEEARVATSINAEVGISWLFSFLTADKKKTYCLYEAASAELIREAARRAGIPADVIIEVSEQRPEVILGNPG